MNRQGGIFLVVFLVSAGVVSWFVKSNRQDLALLAGTSGILFHWALSRRESRDSEEADASYFFGFLLTLVFLAVGLLRLGEMGAGTAGSRHVFSFLKDLAAGLTLTIVGLLVRQIRTLGAEAVASVNSLETKLAEMIDVWRQRPEDRLMEALEQSRLVTASASADFQKQAREDAQRLRAAIERLEDASRATAETLIRAGGQLGSAFQEAVERLNAEVNRSLDAQRDASQKTIASARDLREVADRSLREHLAQWQEIVETGKVKLAQTHLTLDADYADGLRKFAQAGGALSQLTTMALEQVESLPNPTERLEQLWTSVAQLDGALRPAVSGSIEQFLLLQRGTNQLTESLARLVAGVQSTEAGLRNGAGAVSSELSRELSQMSNLVDEYLSLLRKSVVSGQARL